MPDAVPHPAPNPAPVLAALDKLLAERPEQVTHDFSAATRCLTAYHDALIRRVRDAGGGGAAPDHTGLERLNAVISVVYASHYPLGRTDWDRLAQARASFAELAAAVR